MDPVVTSSYTTTPADPDSVGKHSVLRSMVVGKDNIGFFKDQMREDTGDDETAQAGRWRGDDPEDPPPLRISLRLSLTYALTCLVAV